MNLRDKLKVPKSIKMAIAFKPPEITSIGHIAHFPPPQSPPTPPPLPQNHSNGPAVVLQNNHNATIDASITVTDSVPRSVIVQQQQQNHHPVIVPQSVVFHTIPPIFLVSQSPPPSPVYRIVGPRQPCPPAEACVVCKDIQRGLCFYFVLFLWFLFQSTWPRNEK